MLAERVVHAAREADGHAFFEGCTTGQSRSFHLSRAARIKLWRHRQTEAHFFFAIYGAAVNAIDVILVVDTLKNV